MPSRMGAHTGWLLDVYADVQEGELVVWLLDESGERMRFRQKFPLVFYAAGPNERLRELWKHIREQPQETILAKVERRDIFMAEPRTVMEIMVTNCAEQPAFFRQLLQDFPDLEYFDVDIPLSTQYAARFDIFPLTRCRLETDGSGWVLEAHPLEDRWALESELPPLRVLEIEPDCDPADGTPQVLSVRQDRYSSQITLTPPRLLLASMRALISRLDPDLILTRWGDTWLLPHLISISNGQAGLLQLNRDQARPVVVKAEWSRQSFTGSFFRGKQALLCGRWHIDRQNSPLYDDFGQEGLIEMSRVTGLPIQTLARNSPGSAITSMQIITALRRRALVPFRNREPEDFKTAQDLIELDPGGLVFTPITGLHPDAAELDFSSLFPSIITRFNLSVENMDRERLGRARRPGFDPPPEGEPPGLLPETIRPLLEKRLALKGQLARMPARDSRRKAYEDRSAALKTLLVVSYGYVGYKYARFGKVDTQQAVTTYARKALLAAKQTAEEMGFSVLHMIVDGLWVQKDGARQAEDFLPLLEAIQQRTGLQIALDGVFRWIAFLSSHTNERIPVANRYFGVYHSGEIKTRGLEADRRDSPPFIAELQMEMLRRLAAAPDAGHLPAAISEIIAIVRQGMADLREGRIALERLVMQQKLGRAPDTYREPTPAALAAMELEEQDMSVKAGQMVRFVYDRSERGVAAWDAAQNSRHIQIDIGRYAELLFQAAYTVLQPLGIEERSLRSWVFSTRGG